MKKIFDLKKMRPILHVAIGLTLAAVVTSIVAILYAKLFDLSMHGMFFMANNYATLFMVTSPCLFAISWTLVRKFAPEAAGSGIPHVMAQIKLAARGTPLIYTLWLNCKLILIKIASSTLAVLGGGVVGREGPTIRISAAIFEMFEKYFEKYPSTCPSRESLLAAGSGVGLAAAFNTPLAGFAFVIEELSKKSYSTFRGMVLFVVVIAGCVTFMILGRYSYLGRPLVTPMTTETLFIGLIIAFIIGMLGATFGAVLYHMTRWSQSLSYKKHLMLALLVGLVMSSVCVFLGADASGDGSIMIRQILSDPAHGSQQVGWMLAVWRPIGSAITYISGCSCGIFSPSLASGASLGTLFINAFAIDNHNFIINLSMVAFMTGLMRAPMTSFILVLEMCALQVHLLPLMGAALVANYAAKLVEKQSFYDKMCDGILKSIKSHHINVKHPGHII